mgnify:CR=1 FL=1
MLDRGRHPARSGAEDGGGGRPVSFGPLRRREGRLGHSRETGHVGGGCEYAANFKDSIVNMVIIRNKMVLTIILLLGVLGLCFYHMSSLNKIYLSAMMRWLSVHKSDMKRILLTSKTEIHSNVFEFATYAHPSPENGLTSLVK